jgi:type II secretory pathway pseudopilin PulG
MVKSRQTRAAERGYSVVELIFVMGVMTVLASMAAFQIGQSRPAALGDGALRVVIAQMNAARELAITQRRNMRLTFSNGKVDIIRENIPGAPTTISSVLFEGGVVFTTVSGLPDTPDGFGNSSAVVFPTAIGTPPEVKFSPEGTFINQDGLTLNGSIFVALPNQKMSARAVTIMGTTGRIRGYRWNGGAWKPV